MKTISVVVPCHNEEENVVVFYNEMQKIFKKLNYEIEYVFVNDGSKDNTLEVLIELSQKDKRVKVINLSRNFGKEIALSAAIDFATGDAVIPMDADLQDPPEVVPQLIKKWEEGFDVVYATRSKREGDGMAKKLTARLFYKLITSITKVKIPKDTGDFRIMNRQSVDALKELKEHHRFMKGLFTWVGFKQTGIMYERKPRNAGKTKFNYWKLTNLAIEGITSFTIAPLRLATFFGFIVSILSFIYTLYIIINRVVNGVDVPGYSSLMAVVLFLGGVQLLTIGLIGEYVGRIFNETKNRPIYIVRDKYNL